MRDQNFKTSSTTSDATDHALLTGGGAEELARYDFRRIDPSPADAEPIKAAHAAFAEVMAAKLAAQLGQSVEARFQFAEMLRYDEFIYGLPAVSCLSIFRVDPPDAQCCMDVGLPLAYRMIDRLLAGRPDDSARAPDGRPLTRIEQTMILPVIETILSALAEAYAPSGAESVREESLESSPADLRIMPADEKITAIRIDISFSGVNARLSLALPAPVTQMLCDPAAVSTPLNYHQREAQKQDMAGNLLAASVELRAVLAETRMRLDDVLSLNEGDIITTNRAASMGIEARLDVQGRERFAAAPGQLGGSAAVAVTGKPEGSDSSQQGARSGS